MADTEIQLARVALTLLAEPGTRAVHRLVARHGPRAALALALSGEIPDETARDAVAARLAAGDPRPAAEAALATAARLGARLVVPEDAEWPPGLAALEVVQLSVSDRRVDRELAPPLCMWVRGEWPLSDAFDRSVAIVGSRASTQYGEHVATDLAYGLAEREWTVVSGGAFGIDAAAHRGALAAGGLTIAVLACGIERAYPVANTALFDRIAETGLLITEWPPGADPLRPRFLIRNRVIAAATRGTILVEAAARSGATQTIRRAIAMRRPAMVVPGPVTSAMSVGCHEILRLHEPARLVANVSHVLEEVGRIGADLAPPLMGPQHPRDQLDDQATFLLESLPRRGTISPDAAASRAGVDIRTALRKLTLLETLGFVVRREGGYALAPQPRRLPENDPP
ncbi:DNA-processing protein DprA [Asanoa iriomotensis]|uniref:DNA processing protein DprA n=1 Tax=Asanoa iriomotensis TaxID=234613 RepID=A0ABQ4C9J3_9ACTN|nr:DNA-processing protein DprA [Asanoa iriomotensis]GIF59449.1 DNA processing protein DprA [Asanoa iriomotensis]